LFWGLFYPCKRAIINHVNNQVLLAAAVSLVGCPRWLTPHNEVIIMLNDSVLKVSPHGSFKVSQLSQSVVICEATVSDRHNWGNATETEPAFGGNIGFVR